MSNQSGPLRVNLLRAGMRATSALTRMGAAAREQLRGASAVDSTTDEPRRRTLHGQHSRANARETEQMCGDSSSGGAHFSMCTFDRAECTDGRVLAAGGAAIRGSTGRSSEFSDRVLDKNSSDANYRGRANKVFTYSTPPLDNCVEPRPMAQAGQARPPPRAAAPCSPLLCVFLRHGSKCAR